MWLLLALCVVWLFLPKSEEELEAERHAKELQDRQNGGYMTDEQKAKDDAYQKEKAERNRAYARQFRAASNRTTTRGGRGGYSSDQRQSSENEGAADT